MEPSAEFAVAPIPDYRWPDDVPLPYDLGAGVQVVPFPVTIQQNLDKGFVGPKIWQEIQDSRIAFRAAADGEPGADGDPFSGAERRINMANLALWITKPSRCASDSILMCRNQADGAHVRGWSSANPLLPHYRDVSSVLMDSDLRCASRFNQVLAEVDANGTLTTTVRLVYRAIHEDMWEARFLLLWVAVECLFGPEDPRETTFRLSQRVAFYLATDSNERLALYNQCKKSYHLRSKVAHGARLKKLTDYAADEGLHELETLVRRSLTKILSDPDQLGTFQGGNREKYLEELVFTLGQAT